MAYFAVFVLCASVHVRGAAADQNIGARSTYASGAAADLDAHVSLLQTRAQILNGRVLARADANLEGLAQVDDARLSSDTFAESFVALGSAREFGSLVAPDAPPDEVNETSVEAEIESLLQGAEGMASTFEALRAGKVPLDAQEITTIGFVKTHRTGSSTLANIIHRFGEARNLSFVLPAGDTANPLGLGWPDTFPGPEAAAAYGVPRHQFNIICNNAVFNYHRMREYLSLEPFFFTVVRQPVATTLSSLDFFAPPCSAPPCSKDWASRIQWLETLHRHPNQPALGARGDALTAAFVNPQAHDLGWYEYTGGSHDLDNDEKAISNWLKQLHKRMGFVMLTEHFDKGLILLRRKLGLEIQDMAHIPMKRGAPRSPVTPAQHDKLQGMMKVDQMMYDFFANEFWKEWYAAGGEALEAEVHELAMLNRALSNACGRKDNEVCPWSFKTDMVEYTERLRQKQETRVGLFQMSWPEDEMYQDF